LGISSKAEIVQDVSGVVQVWPLAFDIDEGTEAVVPLSAINVCTDVDSTDERLAGLSADPAVAGAPTNESEGAVGVPPGMEADTAWGSRS